MILIPIASNMYEADEKRDRSCDSNMLIGSTRHADHFAIKPYLSLCIYMHRLKWSVIAKQSVCLVDRISMLLSQLLSQLRSQLPSASYMFEAIGMRIMSQSGQCS